MEDIFESLKTFVVTEEHLELHTELLPMDSPWNKGITGYTIKPHSEESKLKMGKAKLGNKHRSGKLFTKEQKQKISKSLKGNTNKSGKVGKQLNPYTGDRDWLNGDSNPAKRPEVREKLRLAALNRKKKTIQE